MKKGVRLDVYLVERKLSLSREKAKREIISGWVKVNEETVREPSRIISGDENVSVERPGGIFVSRGGEKLKHAIEHFGLDVSGLAVADLGASTGGFTDCLLKLGASYVYAIDVGYGQLDYGLRQDPRVFVSERTNVKNLKKEDFKSKVDFITADLSFISILKIVDVVFNVFSPVKGLFLIKPQFEAMKNEHKKGVVKNKETHKAILFRVLSGLIKKGFIFKGLCYSPIKGPAGNIEFLLYFEANNAPGEESLLPQNLNEIIDAVVDDAHLVLNKKS